MLWCRRWIWMKWKKLNGGFPWWILGSLAYDIVSTGMKVLKVLIKVYQRDFKMESINNLFSVINTEDATLIYGGSEFSNWVCEMFGKLCHGLTQENGADVCGRVF